MHDARINVTRSSMPSLEEYVDEIAPLWDSRWLTNMGEKHKQLESELRSYLRVDNVALFANGHLALECTLESMGLPPGGEVITTPFTFASTVHAIVRKGLTPVFADIKDDDYTLDPESVEHLVTPRTCAIVPVHVYGNLCNDEALRRIADEHGLRLIYDAAHAFGVELSGVGAASLGDASMLSFHATKVFNTVEGGAVCFRNPAIYDTLNQWKNFGITGPESVECIGGNAKLDELRCAMGLCNLRHVDDEIALRSRIDARYRERLASVPGIKLSELQKEVRHNFAYMPVIFDERVFGATRDDVAAALANHGVFARKYFFPLVSDYECYRSVYTSEQTPVARWVAQRVLTLPMYAGLTNQEVDMICDVVIGCGMR